MEHLAGVHAQLPAAPYVGLWSRLARFRRAFGPRLAGMDMPALLDEARAVLRERQRSVIRGALLAGGFLAGTWSVTRTDGSTHVLDVEPFTRLPPADAAAAEETGRRLLTFVTGDADARPGQAGRLTRNDRPRRRVRRVRAGARSRWRRHGHASRSSRRSG